jgi:hypothetical protein
VRDDGRQQRARAEKQQRGERSEDLLHTTRASPTWRALGLQLPAMPHRSVSGLGASGQQRCLRR